tara:strand:+ start:98 stop:760 length:663 start_codon:yes stop_codon:yes gene_type:complete
VALEGWHPNRSALKKKMKPPDQTKSMAKTIIVGDSGCGKTALIERLSTDTFDPMTTATIGVDYKVFKDLRGREIKVWDTAGAERFQAVMSLYYRGADSCIVVFDASRTLGMRSVATWTAQVREHSSHCHFFLVGNKIDREQRACNMESAIKLARELGFEGVAFVSAKHMSAQEITRMIQPLFDLKEEEIDLFEDDDKHRPLLGGVQLEQQRNQRATCCWF